MKLMADHIAALPPDKLAFRLTGVYVRWLLGFLGLVALLWVLGFEAIFYHPTPLYALYDPAFSHIAVPLSAAAAMALGYVLLRILLPYENENVMPRQPLAVFSVLLIALIASLAGSREDLAGLWEVMRWHLFAVAVFTAFFGLLRVLLPAINWFQDEPTRKAAYRILFAIIVFAFVFPGSVAMIRGGTEGIAHAYERYDHEYIGDIGVGGSVRGLFADYAELHPHLSMHSKVHPPGPVALLWLLSYVAGRDPMGLAIATMFIGALGVWPLYAWVNDMFRNRRIALTACLLYALMPTIVIFSATSADILFTPLTITTLFLFWRALHKKSVWYAVAGGAMYAVLSLTSFSLIAIGAFFGFVGLWRLADRRYRFSVFQTAFVMIGAFAGVHVLVYLWSGFNVFEVFALAKAQFDTDQAHLDQLTPRYPAWMFKIINPLAWFFYAGIPVSVLCLWRLQRPERDMSKPLFIIFLLTLIALDLLYLARGEGERSAMYIMPFIVIPAAHLLHRLGENKQSYGPLTATLAFLAFQSWLIESYYYTYW